jgi:diguanylate cyclase (GGDEF)-like protein
MGGVSFAIRPPIWYHRGDMRPYRLDFVHPLFQEGGLEEYRRHLIRLSVSVYLFSLGFIFVVSWFLPERQVYWPGVYVVIAMGLLTALALVAVPWHCFHPDWFLTIVVLAVFQISTLIAVTGGDDSLFFILFLFVIIFSGAYFTGITFAVTILLVALGSVGYHLFEPSIHLNLHHLFFLPIYVVAALITNLLFKDLRNRSSQAQHQAQQLEALYEASKLLHAESTAGLLFERILEVARRATGARYAALRTFNEAGQLADFYHAGLSDEERARLKDPPRDVGVLGAITALGPPLRLEDLTHDPRHVGFPPGHPPMKSLLGVPITSGNRLLGKLYLTDKSGEQSFTADDEAVVVSLARDAAVAIEKARLMEQIQALAVTDGLTGLYNYRAFQERLKEEIERGSRYGHACSLLMADMDNFKRVNDTYGHLVGDTALKAIAGALKSQVRNVDLCARYGGEEFAILLPETDKKGALVIAERVRAGVENLPLHTPDDQDLSLTVSIGVASYPLDADNPQVLLRAADVPSP